MHPLEKYWYRVRPLHALLLPASLLFAAATGLRRFAYRAGIARSERLPVPVIVVGNVTAGGTGKTPLTLWLAQALKERGLCPGIVSRGHGGSVRGPAAVAPASDPAQVGDEPVLLASRSGCPVWVGRDRALAARALLAVHPECDALIADDGLQHYALARDFEIAVVDGERRFGNGFPLPAGPLREPSRRLNRVDAVVVNGGLEPLAGITVPQYRMEYRAGELYNLLDPKRRVPPGFFRGKRLAAVAGIGNPARFFATLEALGLAGVFRAFPDHHPFRPEDLLFQDVDAILMTEKDGVKCRSFATEKHWVLPIEAQVDRLLVEKILDQARPRHGSQAA